MTSEERDAEVLRLWGSGMAAGAIAARLFGARPDGRRAVLAIVHSAKKEPAEPALGGWTYSVALDAETSGRLNAMAGECGKLPEDLAASLIAAVLRDDAECHGAPATEPTPIHNGADE